MKKTLISLLLSTLSFSAFAMQTIIVDATHLNVSNAYMADINLRGTFVTESFAHNMPLVSWLEKHYYQISNGNQTLTWKLTYPFKDITDSSCTVCLKEDRATNHEYILKVTGNIYTPDGVYPAAYAKPLKCRLYVRNKR